MFDRDPGSLHPPGNGTPGSGPLPWAIALVVFASLVLAVAVPAPAPPPEETGTVSGAAISAVADLGLPVPQREPPLQ